MFASSIFLMNPQISGYNTLCNWKSKILENHKEFKKTNVRSFTSMRNSKNGTNNFELEISAKNVATREKNCQRKKFKTKPKTNPKPNISKI